MTVTAQDPALPAAQTRRQRITPPLVVGGAVLVASVALHVRDPHQSGTWGFCPWLVLTGTYCPGCGGLRAVNDLTRGDVAAAASSNLLFVSSIPILVGLWLRSLGQRWTGVRRPLPPRVVAVSATVGLVLVVGFWVARNLPGLAWLSP